VPRIVLRRGVSSGEEEEHQPASSRGGHLIPNLGGHCHHRVGSQTLFALDGEHCLIITNLQYVRDPKRNPLKNRENPRYFADTHFDLRKVQQGHALEEQEVVAINHILKCHVRRYIVSPNQDWLYPEKALTERNWSKLGGSQFFLHPDPRPVSFTTAIISGSDKGSWGYNEYGHFDLDGPQARKLRDREWKTFQSAKQAWDDRDQPSWPGAFSGVARLHLNAAEGQTAGGKNLKPPRWRDASLSANVNESFANAVRLHLELAATGTLPTAYRNESMKITGGRNG